jgi:hypothetical protein
MQVVEAEVATILQQLDQLQSVAWAVADQVVQEVLIIPE